MDLSTQLAQLDDALLGQVVTQFPEPLSGAERVRVNAYLVLSHAVLEEQLELVFDSHFRRLSGWMLADLVPIECVRLAYAVAQYAMKDEETFKKRSTPQWIRGRGLKEFRARVKFNHGLKSENVHNLAKLVGLHWDALDAALGTELADLDTLGSKRGSAGHLSPFTESATNISANDGPDNVREWVKNGREAVEAIDRYLRRVVHMQGPSSLIGDWDGN